MDAATNPFSPGAGSQPPELTGRDEVLARTRITLERLKNRRPDRSQMLIGLRGVGKTVMLNRIDDLVRGAGFHSVILEAPENKRLPEILSPELRKILLRLSVAAGAKDKLNHALGALRSFASVFKVNIGDVGIGITSAPGISDSGTLDRDLTDLLVAVGEAAAEKKSIVALLIDELQYVPEEDLGALIAALHRISQLNLPLVLFGAGLPQLAGLAGNAKSYSERLFVFDEIGPLSREFAKAALVDPVRRVGVDFTDGAIDEVIKATEGYPYFLQEWGKHAWIQAKSSPITRQDVLNASGPATADLDQSFFRVRFDRVSPTERDYLRAMAELGPMPHRSGDIANVLERSVELVAPTRARVIKKGMAYAPSHGDTAFTVPKFDEYMKRAIPVFTPSPPGLPRSRKKAGN